jgi:hypothetical protein
VYSPEPERLLVGLRRMSRPKRPFQMLALLWLVRKASARGAEAVLVTADREKEGATLALRGRGLTSTATRWLSLPGHSVHLIPLFRPWHLPASSLAAHAHYIVCTLYSDCSFASWWSEEASMVAEVSIHYFIFLLIYCPSDLKFTFSFIQQAIKTLKSNLRKEVLSTLASQ